jgi:hypothetical protein
MINPSTKDPGLVLARRCVFFARLESLSFDAERGVTQLYICPMLIFSGCEQIWSQLTLDSLLLYFHFPLPHTAIAAPHCTGPAEPESSSSEEYDSDESGTCCYSLGRQSFWIAT